MDTFLARLRKAIKNSGLTHEKIAEKIGVERSTVSHWATGRNTPDPYTLAKLANVLGVSVDYLCGLEEQTWIYELPEHLRNFVREEAMKGPVFLGVAKELKQSGLNPDIIKKIIDILEEEIQR